MTSSYVVRVGYVDDTYWDDGSRWTWHRFPFKTQGEAVAFAREATTRGCKCPGANGEVSVRPEARDVTVERTSKTKVNWEGLG